MAGAEIVWITPDEYRDRGTVFAREEEALKTAGATPFTIPEGASDAVGAWGYIRAAEELRDDLAAAGLLDGRSLTILIATGSGGTAAGLALGVKLLGLDVRVACVNVCDDEDYFRAVISNICDACIAKYKLGVSIDPWKDVEIIDGYVGRGYALSRTEELEFIRDVARIEGMFLDPVYTGKAFYGMASELEKRFKAVRRYRCIYPHRRTVRAVSDCSGDGRRALIFLFSADSLFCKKTTTENHTNSEAPDGINRTFGDTAAA
jgi:D-cysteine desulfhydrase